MKRAVWLLSISVFCCSLCYSYPQDSILIIEGSKIYYKQKGKGKPAVIFVSGLGEDHTTWNTVQDSISKYTSTISYDRAGLGKSGYKGQKKDIVSLSKELHVLISQLKVPKPFILAGHSLGCQVIKKYASLYPKNIKAILFLDPGYNEENLKARLPDSVWQKREKTLKMYLPKFNDAQQQELDNLNRNCEMADRITNLPAVPVYLFTATLINPSFPGSVTELKVKQETHRLWLQSIPGAKHIGISTSRHYIQNDVPDVVIDTLRQLINSK